MRRLLLLFFLILSSLSTPLSFLTPQEASGLGFSATSFWFYVNSPQTISYDEMIFSVYNDNADATYLECSYELIQGIDVSVAFNWTEQLIQPNEKLTNSYSITVASDLEVTHIVRIYLKQKPSINSTSLTVGGIVVNKITYYADVSGSLLDLEIVDQAAQPRDALTTIYFRENFNQSWSPIAKFNDSQFIGYLPNGFYFIQAFDLEISSIYAEEFFELRDDTEFQLMLQLIIMSFRILPRNNLGVNCTIRSYIEEILDVFIYAELFLEGEKILESTKDYRSNFFKTDAYRLVLWFPQHDFKNGSYELRLVMLASGIIIAETSTSFSIEIDQLEDKNQVDDLIAKLGIGFFVLLVLASFCYTILSVLFKISKMGDV